jgi:TetR/AcrR family transcriptional regulator, lmrAB and yxaGH operons repressor
MARDARRRMVQTMGRLMQRQGFHATGLNQVLAESGAPRGSMYHHFPAGKEQLAAEAVTASGAFLAAVIETTLASKETAGTAIRAVIDGMAAGVERSSFEQGCPIATVALETASDSEVIRQACTSVFASWEAHIAHRLEADGWKPAEAASTATAVLAAMEGGLLLARTRHDPAPLRAVGDAVDRLVGGPALRPPSRPT